MLSSAGPTCDAGGGLEARPAVHTQQALLMLHLDAACGGERRAGRDTVRLFMAVAGDKMMASAHNTQRSPPRPWAPP